MTATMPTHEIVAAWREALGGRKFLLCLGCGLVSTMLFAGGILDQNGYLILISGSVLTYISGRTTEAFINKDKPNAAQ